MSAAYSAAMGDSRIFGESETGQPQPASPATPLPVSLFPMIRTGVAKSLEQTLATANTAYVVTLPDNARIIRLFARANRSRVSFGEPIAAVGASSATATASSVFAAGAVLQPNVWEVFQLPAGTSRTVQLRSATAGTVVDVEVL